MSPEIKVGDRVRIIKDSTYSKTGQTGIVFSLETRAIADVVWDEAPHAGCHQTVLVKRLEVVSD